MLRKWNGCRRFEKSQTVEKGKGGLHSTKLPSYEGAYQSQQALIITNNVQTDWQLLLYYSVSPHYFLDDLPMRYSTDAYCLAAILFFYPPCSPFCLYRQENYCHFREQSPEAPHCSLLLMRAPLGTIGSRFMKLSGWVNGPSILPPFAGNHDNKSVESGMAVHCLHRGDFPSLTSGCGGLCVRKVHTSVC